MTLKELIQIRGVDRPAYHKQGLTSGAEWAKGYWSGWESAYNDLKEILVFNGYNLDTVVIEDKVSNTENSQQSLETILDAKEAE
jgi:hypothetical protein